jgi:hypothetical protein
MTLAGVEIAVERRSEPTQAFIDGLTADKLRGKRFDEAFPFVMNPALMHSIVQKLRELQQNVKGTYNNYTDLKAEVTGQVISFEIGFSTDGSYYIHVHDTNHDVSYHCDSSTVTFV